MSVHTIRKTNKEEDNSYHKEFKEINIKKFLKGNAR